MQRNWKIFQNIIVEPTLRGGFFDNIMSPNILAMEGNVVSANGEFVAVSISLLLFI
jgi:hypothetical protein